MSFGNNNNEKIGIQDNKTDLQSESSKVDNRSSNFKNKRRSECNINYIHSERNLVDDNKALNYLHYQSDESDINKVISLKLNSSNFSRITNEINGFSALESKYSYSFSKILKEVSSCLNIEDLEKKIDVFLQNLSCKINENTSLDVLLNSFNNEMEVLLKKDILFKKLDKNVQDRFFISCKGFVLNRIFEKVYSSSIASKQVLDVQNFNKKIFSDLLKQFAFILNNDSETINNFNVSEENELINCINVLQQKNIFQFLSNIHTLSSEINLEPTLDHMLDHIFSKLDFNSHGFDFQTKIVLSMIDLSQKFIKLNFNDFAFAENSFFYINGLFKAFLEKSKVSFYSLEYKSLIHAIALHNCINDLSDFVCGYKSGFVFDKRPLCIKQNISFYTNVVSISKTLMQLITLKLSSNNYGNFNNLKTRSIDYSRRLTDSIESYFNNNDVKCFANKFFSCTGVKYRDDLFSKSLKCIFKSIDSNMFKFANYYKLDINNTGNFCALLEKFKENDFSELVDNLLKQNLIFSILALESQSYSERDFAAVLNIVEGSYTNLSYTINTIVNSFSKRDSNLVKNLCSDIYEEIQKTFKTYGLFNENAIGNTEMQLSRFKNENNIVLVDVFNNIFSNVHSYVFKNEGFINKHNNKVFNTNNNSEQKFLAFFNDFSNIYLNNLKKHSNKALLNNELHKNISIVNDSYCNMSHDKGFDISGICNLSFAISAIVNLADQIDYTDNEIKSLLFKIADINSFIFKNDIFRNQSCTAVSLLFLNSLKFANKFGQDNFIQFIDKIFEHFADDNIDTKECISEFLIANVFRHINLYCDKNIFNKIYISNNFKKALLVSSLDARKLYEGFTLSLNNIIDYSPYSSKISKNLTNNDIINCVLGNEIVNCILSKLANKNSIEQDYANIMKDIINFINKRIEKENFSDFNKVQRQIMSLVMISNGLMDQITKLISNFSKANKDYKIEQHIISCLIDMLNEISIELNHKISSFEEIKSLEKSPKFDYIKSSDLIKRYDSNVTVFSKIINKYNRNTGNDFNKVSIDLIDNKFSLLFNKKLQSVSYNKKNEMLDSIKKKIMNDALNLGHNTDSINQVIGKKC